MDIVVLRELRECCTSYAHQDALGALAMVWFYYFDSLRFFGDVFGDIRTYQPVVPADVQDTPPALDTDAAGEKA